MVYGLDVESNTIFGGRVKAAENNIIFGGFFIPAENSI
jgi:hypothetical protein